MPISDAPPGSFLDHIKGLAACTVAIEPCIDYHQDLRDRGHLVFANVKEAAASRSADIDIAVSFSVIEHVADPHDFLLEISELLKPGGRAIISTPNRTDILMSLLPDDYPAFFYRTVHRWYFDDRSVSYCAAMAGYDVENMACVHRFGLTNAMRWLRDRAPGERNPIPEIESEILDGVWRNFLSESGRGDYLYARLAKPPQ